MKHRANWAVRRELDQRIDAFGARTACACAGELADSLDAIRRIATANDLMSVLPLIRALEAGVAHGERGPAVANGLHLLRDAVHGGQTTPHAAATIAAAHAVRFAG